MFTFSPMGRTLTRSDPPLSPDKSRSEGRGLRLTQLYLKGPTPGHSPSGRTRDGRGDTGTSTPETRNLVEEKTRPSEPTGEVGGPSSRH